MELVTKNEIKRIEKFEMFIEVVDGEIKAYDYAFGTREPDYNTEGILREVNKGLEIEIKEALNVDDLSVFNISSTEEVTEVKD